MLLSDTEALRALFDDIAANLRATVDSIKGYIAETASVLDRMAAGDLAVRIAQDFNGDFMALKQSINGAIREILAFKQAEAPL